MVFNADKARDFLKDSDCFIVSLFENSRKLKEITQYQKVKESLTILCESTFGSLPVAVHFFGSRIIGLATDASDLDIFVDIGERFHSTYKVSKEMDNRFNRLASAVHLNDDWQVRERYLKTAVPVIKSIYNPMQLDCKCLKFITLLKFYCDFLIGDIIMIHGLSTCHSKLLAHWFSLQPEAISLFHFIKQWMMIQGFDHFQGYMMTLLVVFYLQTLKIFPSVETVQSEVPKEIIASRRI